MATEIMNKFGQELTSLTLVPSAGGVFEVSVNNELVFSKKDAGRFPDWKDDLLVPLMARATQKLTP